MFKYLLGCRTGSFGCQIICAQPESVEEDAEVFRPKLVRDLLDQWGITAAKETQEPLMKFKLPLDAENMIKTKEHEVALRDSSEEDEADRLARKLAGYAYVFKNAKGLRDKVCIYYPRTGCIETDVKSTAEAIMNYPKRNEEFGFGNVLFYHECYQLGPGGAPWTGEGRQGKGLRDSTKL